MTALINIQEDIAQQISVGFAKRAIEQNLSSKGFGELAIKEALSNITFPEDAIEDIISTKAVVLGIFFIVIAMAKFGKYQNGGNISVGMGISAAICAAVHHCLNRNK